MTAKGGTAGGFTLVELLVVILIISLLASLFLLVFTKIVGDARWDATKGRVHLLGCKVAEHRVKTAAFPKVLIDLAVAVDQPSWIEGGRFVDAYGRAIEYEVAGRGFSVWSLGRDGVSGTPDDIAYDRK